MSTRLLIALTSLLVGSCFVLASPASAACEWQEQIKTVEGDVIVVMVMVCSDDSAPSAGSDIAAPQVTSAGTAACLGAAAALGQDPAELCGTNSTPAVTGVLVARAFSELPLPASELVVQPPNGRTLVNFATNFYTESESFTRTVTLLGQRVDLRISPVSFGWRFGDGESVSTSTPGAAYPDLQVTHDYLSAGRVAAAVDTTYTAEFRVDGGAWAPVPGTVTIAGAAVPLEVVEATPTLVGYR